MTSIRPRRALASLFVFLALSGAPAVAATGPHDQMLRQLIGDASQGRIAYQTFSPGLAEAVRSQAAAAQAELSALGDLKSVTLETTDKDGMEIYRTVFDKGALDWAFHVNDQGLIDNAIYKPVKAGARQP